MKRRKLWAFCSCCHGITKFRVGACLWYAPPAQVKAVRAGRSFRKATVNSVKGALELGLWAANRPDEFVRTHKVRAKA